MTPAPQKIVLILTFKALQASKDEVEVVLDDVTGVVLSSGGNTLAEVVSSNYQVLETEATQKEHK